MGKNIEFTRPDGALAPGYLSEPDRQDAPGVVMLAEWWGINREIVAAADRLASGGFRVLVPDLYRGRVAATGDEANHLMEGLDFVDAAAQDAPGAARYLRSSGSRKVAVMGFCMGGALAILAAMHVGDFDAAAVFYGLPPAEAGDPGSIRIPVIGHWALQDEFFAIDRVDELEKRFEETGVPHEFHRYEAGHAFANPVGIGNYHRESAELAWSRTLDFLRKNLA